MKNLPLISLLLASFASVASAQNWVKIPEISNKNEQALIIKQSCNLNVTEVRESRAVRDIYIDYRILPVVLGAEMNRDATVWPYPNEEHVIRFMLRSGFSAVETEKGFSTSVSQELPKGGPVVRFETKPLGSEACRAWDRQFSHPLSTLPELRRLGLRPDQCIGISERPHPEAQGRIQVERTRLYYDPNVPNMFLWRLNVSASSRNIYDVNVESSRAVLHLSLGDIGRYGDSNIRLFCSEHDVPPNKAALAILDSLPSSNRPISLPTVIGKNLDNVPYAAAQQFELESIAWLRLAKSYRGMDSYYGIDEHARVWVEGSPGRSNKLGLWAVENDRILQSEIPIESERLRYLTRAIGLIAGGGYAVLVELKSNPVEFRLFWFDSKLVLFKASTLTPKQWEQVRLESDFSRGRQ